MTGGGIPENPEELAEMRPQTPSMHAPGMAAEQYDQHAGSLKTITYDDSPPNRHGLPTGSRPTELTCDGRNGYSCVDLKSMAKLKRLCNLLRTNVTELRTVYKKRLELGYAYSKSERVGLDTRLQSLDDNVSRLFGKLDEISGYRREIKDVVDVYTQHESEYRLLRSLNRNARFRRDAKFFKTANALRNEPAEEDESPPVASWPSIIIKYLCHPCLNKPKKPKKKCHRKNSTNKFTPT